MKDLPKSPNSKSGLCQPKYRNPVRDKLWVDVYFHYSNQSHMAATAMADLAIKAFDKGTK